MRMACKFACLATLALAACGGRQRTQGRAVSTVAYRFECNPRDATLIVDEVSRGQCILWERQSMGLGPGTHRLRVDRDGYLPHEAELRGEGPRGTLHIQLRVRPE